MAHRLPLFPLKLVLLPGSRLTLRLFEPRYLAMLDYCLKNKSSFGIVLVGDHTDELGTLARVGCEARLLEYSAFDDGSFLVKVEGGARFRVRDISTHETPFFMGDTDPVHDDNELGQAHSTALQSLDQLLEAYLSLIEDIDPVLLQRLPHRQHEADPTFQAFEQIPLQDTTRQQVLETFSARKRCELGALMLKKEIEKLRFLLSDTDEDAQSGQLN